MVSSIAHLLLIWLNLTVAAIGERSLFYYITSVYLFSGKSSVFCNFGVFVCVLECNFSHISIIATYHRNVIVKDTDELTTSHALCSPPALTQLLHHVRHFRSICGRTCM